MTTSGSVPETPFPFHSVSNGEWEPPAPSRKQRAAARLYVEESERRARRLGISRREFMRSAAGMATAFMVLNTVAGLPGIRPGPEAEHWASSSSRGVDARPSDCQLSAPPPL